MTVIAYRDGVLAADTAVWQGGVIVGHVHKVLRLGGNRLVACTGQRGDVVACRAWLDGEGERPLPVEEGRFGALLLDPKDGLFHIDHRFRVFPETDGPYAVEGAHTEFLLGALRAGATAEEAVRYAIELGDCAGGTVQALRLE